MRVPARAFALVVVAAAVAAALIATISARGREPARSTSAASWRGLVGGPRAPVPNGQRSIVVLRTPSLGERLARARYATEARERVWTSQATAAQQEVLTTLAIHGVLVRPDFTYQRVLDGFSAALDPRAIALLDQMPEVVGVYPVRPAFPASVSETLLSTSAFGGGSGHRPDAGLPGLRRPRRDGCAARHGRRPCSSVLAQQGAARLRHRRRQHRRRRTSQPAGLDAARTSRHRNGRDHRGSRRPRRLARRRARRDHPPDPRRRLAAGRRRE